MSQSAAAPERVSKFCKGARFSKGFGVSEFRGLGPPVVPIGLFEGYKLGGSVA